MSYDVNAEASFAAGLGVVLGVFGTVVGWLASWHLFTIVCGLGTLYLMWKYR